MSVRGPVPKRSTERRRRNKESVPEIVTLADAPPVEVPKVNAQWHPTAKVWFESLAKSGQAQFYEPSDWALALYIAEAMSRNLRQGGRFSSVLFASVLSGMADLLTTEASRRRVRMEIERAGAESGPAAGVTAIGDYRKRLVGKSGG